MISPDLNDSHILLAGATGTIGQAVAHALVGRGYRVTCLCRTQPEENVLPHEAGVLIGNIAKPETVSDLKFDVAISCLASRTGVKKDAWAIDYQANVNLLALAKNSDASQFILLSAICVQRPKLAFQHAKLAFEKELQDGGIDHQIVRPTAFFKSLSGQVEKVAKGKNFLVFGDGKLTACKPISDCDLANFIVDQIGNRETRNSILPIGGPGPAIAPLDQAEHLFELLGHKPRIKHVPLKLMDVIIAGLSTAARFFPSLEEKAEYARIGRYYASESMLVYDDGKQAYDADATPEYGSDTLFEYYENLVRTRASN